MGEWDRTPGDLTYFENGICEVVMVWFLGIFPILIAMGHGCARILNPIWPSVLTPEANQEVKFPGEVY